MDRGGELVANATQLTTCAGANSSSSSATAPSSSPSPGCLNCHLYLGAGSSNLGAPDLTETGRRSRHRVPDRPPGVPAAASRRARTMPAFAELGEDNLRELAAFLEASKGKKTDSVEYRPELAGDVGLRVFLGITGASGAPYAARLLEALADRDCEIGVCASAAGRRGARDRALRRPAAVARRGARAASRARAATRSPSTTRDDWSSPYASGSAQVDATSSARARWARSARSPPAAMANLIHRAASRGAEGGAASSCSCRARRRSRRSTSRTCSRCARPARSILFARAGLLPRRRDVDDLVDFVVGALPRPARARHALVKRWGESMTRRDRPAARGGRPGDVRPHRAGLRRDEPRDDRRPRPALAAARRPQAVVRPGDRVLDACCGTGDLALAARAGGGRRHRARLLGADARARAPQVGRDRVGRGDLLALPFADGASTRRRSASASATSTTSSAALARAAPRAAPRRAARRSSRSRGPRAARAVLPALVRRRRPAARQGAARAARVHVPAGERAALPGPGGARGADARGRLRDVRYRLLAGGIVALHTGARRDARSPTVRDAPGLDDVPRRARGAARARGRALPGARRARSAPRRSPPAASGCGRCSSSSPRRRRPAAGRRRRRGRARPHGDARPRRPDRRRRAPARRAAAWSALRRRPRRARPATTSSRAPSPSSRDAATPRPSACSPTRRSASRAARRCSARRRTTRTTTVDDVPRALRAQDREALRGRVPARRAATRGSARSGSRSASPSRSPTTSSTARARRSRPARSRAPTCARGRRRCRCCSPRSEDEVVRAALAGGPLDGALVRVAATGALEQSREVALDYASQRARVPRRRAAPRRARGADLRRRGPGGAEWPIATHRHARRDPREGGGGRAARLRGRPRAARVGRPARARRARRPRAPAARRRRRGLLRPEPLPEPDERLPREVQVLRLRAHAEAGGRLHATRPRSSSRTRVAPARADRLHRDPHGRRREPARRLRLLRRHRRARCTRRCRTST